MKKLIVPGVLGFSSLWILCVLVYTSIFFGWQNLTYLLPSELAVVALALFLPVIVGLAFILIMEIASKVDALATSIGGQTRSISEIADQITVATDDARQSRDTRLDARDLQVVLSRVVSEMIEAQGGFRPPAVIGEGQIIAKNLNPNDFSHLGTLMTLFNVALNDLSVITTRLLVSMLDGAGRNKEDVRTFITGLLDAYTSGDKNVFFRALQHELEVQPEYLNVFKELTANSPDMRSDVSKILREAQEIMLMVQRCDPQNLIRIVFEGGDLWGLQQFLFRHFDTEGNVRDTENIERT